MRILLLLLIMLPLATSCSDEPAEIPNDCIQAAEEAGVPSVVIRYMERPPEEWGSLERLAIRDVLEDYDLSNICPDVALSIEQGPETTPPPTASPDAATPSAETTAPVPPQIPFSSPIARSTPRSSELSPTRGFVSGAQRSSVLALWMALAILVIYAVLFGGGCALIASRKGLNPTPGFLIGVGLGPIGLAIVWIIPGNRRKSS